MIYNYIYSRDIDETMSHIDFMFSAVTGSEKGTQGGVFDADTVISVMRRGSFAFNLFNLDEMTLKAPHANYLAEKLFIDSAEAEAIIDVINNSKNYNVTK